MLVEVASLFHLLGGMAARHLTLIGGVLPPLLVAPPAPPHRGSGDIDLSLSLAISKGETSAYYRSLEERLMPYFEPTDAGFRWRKRLGAGGVSLLVDFMGAEVEATQIEDGTLQLETETAAANVGVRLRPYPLRAASVVDEDAILKKILGVPLVYDPGVKANVEIRHSGPVGFLASKADAFASRHDDKDGYDVAWWCLNAAPGAAAVAALVTERSAFRDPYFQESVAILDGAFEGPDFVGPVGFAREEGTAAGDDDRQAAERRNLAYAAVSPVLEILKSKLWSLESAG
jgi:hypothetical protein